MLPPFAPTAPSNLGQCCEIPQKVVFHLPPAVSLAYWPTCTLFKEPDLAIIYWQLPVAAPVLQESCYHYRTACSCCLACDCPWILAGNSVCGRCCWLTHILRSTAHTHQCATVSLMPANWWFSFAAIYPCSFLLCPHRALLPCHDDPVSVSNFNIVLLSIKRPVL